MLDPASSRPTRDMVRRAAQWAAELDDEAAPHARRVACEAWCAADARHRIAFDRVRGLDDRFAGLDRIEQNALSRVARQPRDRWRPAALGLLLAGLLAGGWLASDSLVLRNHWPDQQTGTGEIRVVRLDDGSTLHLDTDSSIGNRPTASERRISLYRGQVMAEVAKDRQRPFVVRTREGSATALGTIFSVRRDTAGTVVTVIESRVRVCADPVLGSPDCAELGAGQRARLADGKVVRLAPANPEQAAAWTKGWLEADDMPLPALLTELGRYRARPILYEAEALSARRITGSFPLSDPDRALTGIAGLSGLAVYDSPAGTRVEPRR